MSKNRFYTVLAFLFCWGCFTVSCRKDSPTLQPASCNDGTCCGPRGVQYNYQETFTNEPAYLIGPTGGWFLKFTRPVPTGTSETWQHSAAICELSEDKAMAIRQTVNADSTTQFRVWGQLYFGPITLVSVSRYFTIDRIEVVK